MDLSWLLDEFDELVYVSDINTYELLYINKSCLAFLGVENANDFVGKKCYVALQGKTEPCPFCTNKLITYDCFYKWEFENKAFNRHFVLKDRKLRWNGHEARIEFAVDVTAFQNKIDKTETELQSIVKSIPGGVCKVDAKDGMTILWHNDVFLELIGYTKEQFDKELNGKASYVCEEDLVIAHKMMTNIMMTHEPDVYELKIRRRDGTKRNLITTLSYDDTTSTPCFYSIGVDITEYKKEEERSKEAVKGMLRAAEQANAAKGAFLSRMSHEIRTPLNAVIGMSSIAEKFIDNKEKVLDCHKKITSAANYLLSLINDILDISKIDSGKMVLAQNSFSFQEIISDIITLFTMQMAIKEVNFRQDAEYFEEDTLIGDSLRLKQVIVNLLSNAVKFTDKGGYVDFRVRKTKTEEDRLWVEFTVKDTGIGMPQEFLEKAFNMFEQANVNTSHKYGGSGLGLTICKYIVDLMNGSIKVKSKEGKGSEFIVTVPLKISGKHLDPSFYRGQSSGFADGIFASKRILVVEDNELNSEILCTMLQFKGMVTEIAWNGTQAVSAFLSKPVGYYDAIFMDIRMPEMDGLTAAKLIRSSGKLDSKIIPIIALSANAFEDDRQKSVESGMNSHIAKPINEKELFGVLAKFI